MLLRVERFSRNHYRLVFVIALVLVAAALLLGRNIRLESDILQLLPKDNPKVSAFREALADFGSIDYLLVVHPKGLADSTLYAIDQFVMRGGRLVVCVDAFHPDSQRTQQTGQLQLGTSRLGALGEMLAGWNTVLTDLFTDTGVPALDAATTQQLTALTAAVFLGAESLILLGMEDDDGWPIRPALRAVGDHLRALEEGTPR